MLALPSLTSAEGAPPEPSVGEVQQAAARLAGGEAGEDASRTSRARAAHWAPVLHALVGRKDDAHVRDGQFRDAPVHLNDSGNSISWGISATWDLPQTIYSRDEAQLSHARLHLAKARLQAATEAARLFLDRREKLRALSGLPAGQVAARARLLLEILRLTADLDARTGGLFHDALENEAAESTRAAELAARPPLAAPATPQGKQ